MELESHVLATDYKKTYKYKQMKQYLMFFIVFLVLFVLLITCVSCSHTEKYVDSTAIDPNAVVARLWISEVDYMNIYYKNIYNKQNRTYLPYIPSEQIKAADKAKSKVTTQSATSAQTIPPKSVTASHFFTSGLQLLKFEVAQGLKIVINYKDSTKVDTSSVFNNVANIYWSLYNKYEPATSEISSIIITPVSGTIVPLRQLPTFDCYMKNFYQCQNLSRGYASPEDTVYEGPMDRQTCGNTCTNNNGCKSMFWGLAPNGTGYCYNFRNMYGNGSVWRNQPTDNDQHILSYVTANKL